MSCKVKLREDHDGWYAVAEASHSTLHGFGTSQHESVQDLIGVISDALFELNNFDDDACRLLRAFPWKPNKLRESEVNSFASYTPTDENTAHMDDAAYNAVKEFETRDVGRRTLSPLSERFIQWVISRDKADEAASKLRAIGFRTKISEHDDRVKL